MALRLSITPTFNLSRKFTVLHAGSLHWIRLSSPSLGHVLICYPLSKPFLKSNSSSFIRLTSIRHRTLTSSYSEQSRDTEEDALESIVAKPSETKSAINYSLSSGFLTNQRDSDGYSKRSLIQSGESRQQGGQEPQRVVKRDSKLGDGSSTGFRDGYSQKLVSHIGESREQDGRLGAKRHSNEPYNSSGGPFRSRDGYDQIRATRFGEGSQGNGQEARGMDYNERERRWMFSNDSYANDSDSRSRKRGEQEFEDELNSSREVEGGDWLGSRTEGKKFRNSKLFKEPRVSLNNRMRPRNSRDEIEQNPRQEFEAEELEAWKQAERDEGFGSCMEGQELRNSNLVKEARFSSSTNINSRSSRDAIWSSLDEEVDKELDIGMDSRGIDWSGSEASNLRNPYAKNKSVAIRSSSKQDLEDDMDAWQDSDRLGAAVNELDFGNSKSYKGPRTSLINEMTPRYAPRSIGARTIPSKPSIPGKFSKYSKSAHQGTTPTSRTYSSPSFSSSQSRDISSSSSSDDSKVKDELAVKTAEAPTSPDWIPAVIKPDFDYQFSYTETPKVAPIGFREPVYSPFGPGTMARPWTGRAPSGKSKKKLPEFDSFKPPPPGKKGVKRVQQPGPYPEGQGPKEAYTREEILGEPLTKAEVKELVDRCLKESRQLNLGRDGLTHNMLDLVHQHWKRRRVCRIKCKGVPTVDMDNVCEKLEEKTGGKIIQRAGGVVYVYRGRNYNYKNRPNIPLMLWKPPAPIYPKLIQTVPEGLTKEEAYKLRSLGRNLSSICRLGKNGVYLTLVADVRNAFKVDDLVKVDCKGLNPSDFKKIGAKLKDLVPCVLLSFERECILMWKGQQSQPENSENDGSQNATTSKGTTSEIVLSDTGQEFLHETLLSEDSETFTEEVSGNEEQQGDLGEEEEGELEEGEEGELVEDEEGDSDSAYNSGTEAGRNAREHMDESDKEVSGSSDLGHAVVVIRKEKHDTTEMRGNLSTQDLEIDENRDSSEAEVARNDIEQLWEQAIEAGEATVLDHPELDPDNIFQKVKLSCGSSITTSTAQNSDSLQNVQSKNTRSDRLEKGRLSKVDDSLLERTAKDPKGLLRVDELAKLLAP